MMKLPIWFSEYLDRFEIDKRCSTVVTRSWANVSRMRPADNGQIKNYQDRLAMAIHLWKTGCRQATGDALKLFGRFVSEKFFPGESTNSREYYRPESVDSALIWRLFMAAALSECCQDELLCNLEQTWKTWTKAVRDRLHKHLKTSASTFGAALSDCDFLTRWLRKTRRVSLLPYLSRQVVKAITRFWWLCHQIPLLKQLCG